MGGPIDNYVRKMSDEVDMEVDMNNDVRIDEDIHKDYDQETGKTVDCSKAFITTKSPHLAYFSTVVTTKQLFDASPFSIIHHNFWD
ncbi:hypothetical protein JHK87_052134 [Glycine soja]|nr:hypothetical protein JHK87_052134 [Glycine soja]